MNAPTRRLALALAALLPLACSDSPTAVQLVSAPAPPSNRVSSDQSLHMRQSASSSEPWVVMVSGGLSGFENGTGTLLPFGQLHDHNYIQVNLKLYGDGSVDGSFTAGRMLVKAGEAGTNLTLFHFVQRVVTCLEVQGNQAWIGSVVEKEVTGIPPGTEVVTQLVSDADGTAWIQGALAPASSCAAKPDLPNKYRFDHGSLRIVDRR